MYKGLYDEYRRWFNNDKGQVFFYSDPHFSDIEMNKLRGITDEEQIKKINSKIGKYDTLIILGDIGNVDCVKKLRGYKVLIMGNHDSGRTNFLRIIKPKAEYIEKVYNSNTIQNNMYLGDETTKKEAANTLANLSLKLDKNLTLIDDNHLFDEVYEGGLQIAERLYLSHEPVDYASLLNIHGHVHSLSHIDDATHINMCAEHINYTPICLKDIIKSGKIGKIPTIHRETIDEATERKKKRIEKAQKKEDKKNESDR